MRTTVWYLESTWKSQTSWACWSAHAIPAQGRHSKVKTISPGSLKDPVLKSKSACPKEPKVDLRPSHACTQLRTHICASVHTHVCMHAHKHQCIKKKLDQIVALYSFLLILHWEHNGSLGEKEPLCLSVCLPVFHYLCLYLYLSICITPTFPSPLPVTA